MKISSINELKKITENIREKILPGDNIFLFGEIGVGKTTFARVLINSFEKKKQLKESEVLSPTFNIIFEYDIKDFIIKHYDLYRLSNDKDIENIGLFENLDSCINVIEWPELITKKPINRIDLFFEYADDDESRLLNIKAFGRLKDCEFN